MATSMDETIDDVLLLQEGQDEISLFLDDENKEVEDTLLETNDTKPKSRTEVKFTEEDERYVNTDPNVFPKMNLEVAKGRTWNVRVFPLHPRDFRTEHMSDAFSEACESIVYLLHPGQFSFGKAEMFVNFDYKTIKLILTLLRTTFIHSEINIHIIKKHQDQSTETAQIRFDHSAMKRFFQEKNNQQEKKAFYVKNIPVEASDKLLMSVFPFATNIDYLDEEKDGRTRRVRVELSNSAFYLLKAYVRVEINGHILELQAPSFKRISLRTSKFEPAVKQSKLADNKKDFKPSHQKKDFRRKQGPAEKVATAIVARAKNRNFRANRGGGASSHALAPSLRPLLPATVDDTSDFVNQAVLIQNQLNATIKNQLRVLNETNQQIARAEHQQQRQIIQPTRRNQRPVNQSVERGRQVSRGNQRSNHRSLSGGRQQQNLPARSRQNSFSSAISNQQNPGHRQQNRGRGMNSRASSNNSRQSASDTSTNRNRNNSGGFAQEQFLNFNQNHTKQLGGNNNNQRRWNSSNPGGFERKGLLNNPDRPGSLDKFDLNMTRTIVNNTIGSNRNKERTENNMTSFLSQQKEDRLKARKALLAMESKQARTDVRFLHSEPKKPRMLFETPNHFTVNKNSYRNGPSTSTPNYQDFGFKEKLSPRNNEKRGNFQKQHFSQNANQFQNDERFDTYENMSNRRAMNQNRNFSGSFENLHQSHANKRDFLQPASRNQKNLMGQRGVGSRRGGAGFNTTLSPYIGSNPGSGGIGRGLLRSQGLEKYRENAGRFSFNRHDEF